LVAPVDILRRANVKFFLYVQMLMIWFIRDHQFLNSKI
jgi:hypothetical protein